MEKNSPHSENKNTKFKRGAAAFALAVGSFTAAAVVNENSHSAPYGSAQNPETGTQPEAAPARPEQGAVPPDNSTTPNKPDSHNFDNGKLPGDPNVPADQDKGTPDIAGVGPAGQTRDNDGFLLAEQGKGTPDIAGVGPAAQTPDKDGFLPQEKNPDTITFDLKV